MDILINVSKQRLKLATNLKKYVSGSQEFVRFVFGLNSYWRDLLAFAQFAQNGNTYNRYLDDENAVYLPSEIVAGECTLTLFGSGNNVIATTNYLTLTIDENILVSDASSTDISETLYEQLVDMVRSVSNGTTVVDAKNKMTDKNKIYVYIGSETGMTNGNWYYWNGTVWISGGVWNAVAVETDKTLSVENKAADGKAAGTIVEVGSTQPTSSVNKIWIDPTDEEIEIPEMSDLNAVDAKVSNLKSDLSTHKVNMPLDANNQPTDGTSGQMLRTNGDGSTEWTDFGLPTDAQTAQAISDWLDDNPEATTTVQDGSLTESKLSDALKLKTIKDHVTAEMFGAVGDGTTDDTNALLSAFQSGKIVLLTASYLLSDEIALTNGFACIGKNASIICSGSGGIVFNNTENINFDGIKFEGQSSTNHVLYFYHCSNVRVSNCEFDTVYYAIGSDATNYLTIYNCNIHDSLYLAINVIGTCHDVTISKTISKDNNSQGIGVSGGICTNCIISECHIEGNGDSNRGGIYAQGINTHGIQNGKIIGNTIIDNVSNGLDLSGHNSADVTVPRSKDIIVSNNYISNNLVGIILFSTQNVLIEGNYIDAQTVCISIGTSFSGDFGTQNISILNNVFGDVPNSSGTYQGVITFSAIKAQTRNIAIENNTFNVCTNVSTPYISAAYVNTSDSTIADLISGWTVKNNYMPRLYGSGVRKVKNGANPYQFAEVDEKCITLFGNSITDLHFGWLNRANTYVTKVQIIAATTTTVTFTIQNPNAVKCFDYTNERVYDGNRIFNPSAENIQGIDYSFTLTASADVTVNIFYTDLI